MDTTDATVLLVDDDAAVRKSLDRLLRCSGWQTRSFASAQEFIDSGRFDGIGCLVLDVALPGMTGPELHEWLRTHAVTLPVIYLSGEVDVPTSVLAMKRGAVDVLEKPVKADVLLQAVDHAVEIHRQQFLRRHSEDELGSRLASLSQREREVLDKVIHGWPNKRIAEQMGIVLKTVKVHRGRAMAKMRARSVAELMNLCHRLGIAG